MAGSILSLVNKDYSQPDQMSPDPAKNKQFVRFQLQPIVQATSEMEDGDFERGEEQPQEILQDIEDDQ